MSRQVNEPIKSVWAKVGRTGLRADASPGETITARTYRSVEPSAPRAAAPVESTFPIIPIDASEIAGASTAALRGAAAPDLRLAGLLGEGGMGRVHLARQRSLGRDVAVKVIKPSADDAAREALFREGAFMGLLEHPNIVPVHALGRDEGGSPLLVMKRIEGVSWRELIADPSHPAWSRIEAAPGDRLVAHLQILMQVCNALALAHRRGVVHRDIKPANVMLGELGEVYLVDFGIALKLDPNAAPSTESMLVGSPGYMPPEMAACETHLIDARTDVYLLGATLHEVLTGERRHTGGDLLTVLMAAHASAPFAYGPSVPAELAAICNRATAAAREDRFPTVLALRHAIAGYLQHRGSLALTEAAAARLDELRRVSGAGDAQPERIHRLMTECRFGFMQALREWPENPEARRGLEACLDAMFERELLVGNADGARALLAELPSAAREARVALLEAAAREKAARVVAADRLERDLDVSASARGRAILFSALFLGGVGLAVQTVVRGADISKYDHDEVLLQAGATLAGAALLTAIFRRYVLGNAVSRRIVASALLGPAVMLASRVIARVTGQPLTQVLLADHLVFITLIAMAGINVHRPILWTLPILGAGLVVTAGWPELSAVAFTVSTLTICVGVGLTGLRARTSTSRAPTSSR